MKRHVMTGAAALAVILLSWYFLPAGLEAG
jgi:hypothetical protein